MIKAILILDEMPKNCWDCPICYDFIACPVAEKGTPMNDADEDARPDFCPLRPMPKKEPPTIMNDEYDDGYVTGWNRCIDQMEGSGEDA